MQPFASAGAVMASSEIAATMHANVFGISFSRGWVGFKTLRGVQKFRGCRPHAWRHGTDCERRQAVSVLVAPVIENDGNF
jgi:hypothetical protein